MKISRRGFIQAGVSLGSTAIVGSDDVYGSYRTGSNIIDWSGGFPPLFCIAYINPGIKSHQGQESTVAKYPIALVPQDDRYYFHDWKNRVKDINPDMKFLAYQMVIEETTVPGPGHDIMRSLSDNVWVRNSDGTYPKVTFRTSVRKRDYRIYDPRSKEWQDGFVDACESVLDSYNYSGLFLDQCSVYMKATFNPIVRLEMFRGIQYAIDELRNRRPEAIIIANSKYDWYGLNGEMNEGRFSNLKSEISNKVHVDPEMNMFHYYYKDSLDFEQAKRYLRYCLENKVFFGMSINNQKVEWFDCFDEMLKEYFLV